MRCSCLPHPPLCGWLRWDPWASGSTPGGWAHSVDSLPCTTSLKGLQYNSVSCPFSQAQGWLAGGYPGQEEGLDTLFPGFLLTCRACLCRTAPKRMGRHVRSSQVIYTELRWPQLFLRPQARRQAPSAQSTCPHSDLSSRPRAGPLRSQPVISSVLGQTTQPLPPWLGPSGLDL